MEQKKSRGQTVLVTGAAGTVGHLVVALAESQGFRVVATDRNIAGLRMPVRGEVRQGDLRDNRFLEQVVKGVDHVIHTAAELDAEASLAELSHINSEAVARLYEAASAAKVKRFFHVSTAMLYATGQSAALTEVSPLAPRGPYGLSKHGAEMFLRAATGSPNAPSWTILRAAPIYGRRGRHLAAGLLVLGPILRLGTPILPCLTGGPSANLVHAEDVALALLFCLTHDVTANMVLNVADDDPMPLGDRWTETFRAYGLNVFGEVKLQPWLLRSFMRVIGATPSQSVADMSSLLAWRMVVLRHGLKHALRPKLDREGLTLLDDDLVIDASKLKGLGWTCRYPRFHDGWAEVLRWYQAERWVPRYV